ncbi:MAG: hypothetical protein KC766_26655 [Myxococcales bacterium]|nr:hypothetical protein [Myxococcales bacterium]
MNQVTVNERGAWMRATRWLVLGGVACGALLSSGCSQKNQEKCNEAMQVTRQSISSKDFNLARQWRERAYTYCEASSASVLDGEITAAEKAELDAEAKKKARKATADAITALVKQLAEQGKDDGSKIAKSATCPDKKEKKEGWCEATRSAAGDPTPIKVKYWNEEPKAFIISTKPLGPASCDALGPNTVVRTFGSTVDGKVAEFKHCNLSGSLGGLQALVGSSEELSLVQVFTSEYLAKDPKLAKRLKGS